MAIDLVTAVVLAAGEGTRMNTAVPKVLLEVAGRPVLSWSVGTLAKSPQVDSVVVAAHPDLVTTVAAAVGEFEKVEAVVPGGATRSASVQAALDVIAAAEGTVLVHDAARPAVTGDMIAAVLAALGDAAAATVAIPAADTILEVDDGRIAAIPDRSSLWLAQTPQAFRLSTLRAAYRAAGPGEPDFTDDCGIVRRYLPDVPIRVVPGSAENVKITRLEDVAVVETILGNRGRSG